MTYAIFLALAPVFFVMFLGYGAGRLHIVDNYHVDGFNALVMNFALPASLFVATASASRVEMFAQASLFATFGLVMLAMFLAWYSFAHLVSKASKADASLQALTIAFPNLAGVGLPMISAVLGPTGTVPIATALAAGSIIVSPLSLIIVELNVQKGAVAESRSKRIAKALWHALTKPVVLAPALGILFSLSGLATGRVIDSCLILIGQSAPGVALFLTGLVLSSQAFRMNWIVVCAAWMADIVRPLLMAAIAFGLPLSAETAKIAILLAAVPSGFFGILFAVNYRLDSAATGSMVIASTAMSVVTMAIAIVVLFPQ
ncbi:AEC family transporter [Phyllobacterium zundukense]|uniref:AEC family transporter n=1 Tax=Phyllobacterium zundukense TaxID=1867719 RepID=A0ACD4CY01_9HYPH|nr:AEC family transporter [Phyllobacterium zundukense]UXN58475.1 AEC family transporter [Phyllobacterium zundukense]